MIEAMTDRLDPDALDRVVRRAAELDEKADDEGIEVDAVVAAAEEVGISPAAIRTSVALERLGPEPTGNRLDRVVGARSIMAERTMPFDAEEAFERLDHWLSKGHHLRREQRRGFEAEWRRRNDLAAKTARSVKSFTGSAGLSTVRLIAAQVSAIDETSSIVRIMANRSVTRSTAIGVSGGLTAASIGGAAVFAAVAPPLAIIGIPGLAAAGVTTVGAKRSAELLERELIRLLDMIDEGRQPRGRRRSKKR